jgi:hypothetical protein
MGRGLSQIQIRWRKVSLHPALSSLTGGKCFRREVADGTLTVIISVDDGLFHLSISHKGKYDWVTRYPTWDEIVEARYHFCPDGKDMVMHLPPREEYVNIHETTFHLFENPKIIGG